MAKTKYLDFDVILTRNNANGYQAKVQAVGCGELTFAVALPQVEDIWASTPMGLRSNLRDTRPANANKRAELKQQSDEAAKTIGASLFEALFPAEALGIWTNCLNKALNQGADGVRIRLRFTDTPELAVLPWEYLYRKTEDQFLVLSPTTLLVRYLDTPSPPVPLMTHLPLRILVVISSPKDLPALDVEEEWQNIQGAIRPLVEEGLVQLVRLPKATRQALIDELLRDSYHILHFIGHGDFDKAASAGSIFMENNLGEAEPYREDTLALRLKQSPRLRLIILNCCRSAEAGTADIFSGIAGSLVKRGMPCVIAMRRSIADKAAIDFTAGFYRKLANGYGVDVAVVEGRMAIMERSEADYLWAEWGTPVLYLRTSEGHIFDIEEVAEMRQRKERLRRMRLDVCDAMERQEWEYALEKIHELKQLA